MKRRFRTAIISIFIDLLTEYRLSSTNDRTDQITDHYFELESIESEPQLYHLCV